MKKEQVTMRDIAGRLGISTVTVSKALNDKEGVSEELKARIKETAKEMGYRLNLAARAMKDGLSYNIGVIIPEQFTNVNHAFYLRVYQHIASRLEAYGYSSILHILTIEDEEALNLPRIYYEKKADGIIILGQIKPAYIEAVQQMTIPKLFLDFYQEGAQVDSIVTDNFYGSYELVSYLIREGHRQLAFVGNIHATSSIQDRFLGYYKSLLEHRIPLDPDWIIKDRDEQGILIDLELPTRMPTAFVCNCDQVARALIEKLKKEGIQVPADCSVVGYDNDIFATVSEPQLTTVEVDMEMLAGAAVKTMMKKISRGEASTGRTVVQGRIIYRDSVKSLTQAQSTD
ncbi:substrate-binding domain-containing protein [Paenibacillus aquistagni]|uniref:Transcriptional regulator, LacI family n=1 Tax=Paenibacillus aquistagni TaxID=1852522 RepID=A0A1X7KRH5_9BACL|nr:substrate-binding domain-containing protein [Paenibacillus aquistagni]SMG43902.1 transcriptional regulator, LacI family [Paenibacillus aquistagni]